MTDLNTIAMVGRVVKQPSLETAANGNKWLTFTIAVNRDRKNPEKEEWYETVSYIDLTVFGKRAESLQKWLLKGKAVSVRGYLKEDTWEKDGQKKSALKVVPQEVNPFVERPSKESGAGEAEAITATAEIEEPEIY